MDKYSTTSYEMTASEGVDELTVAKTAGSDWAEVTMVVNGGVHESRITLRSLAMAEQLHFMLGQMTRSHNV